MRYTESRDESATVLRMALAEMGRHEAAFNPFTFAVWYEHMAGMNPALSRSLEARLAQAARLDSAALAELYRAHVADPGSEEAARISGDFRRVMQDIAQASDRTGESARSFGEQQIEHLRSELDRSRIEVVTDPLTRVLNRRGFDQAVERLLAQPAPADGSHCLILFDIDHFKRINDQHGHLTGDAVLEAVGGVLKSVAAKAARATWCARYGGEEFALLVEGAALVEALQLAHAVCALVRSLELHNRRTGAPGAGLTISAGVAAWQPGDAAASWVACADRALYRSKETGRDRVTVG
jgi:diguanylate cyclase